MVKEIIVHKIIQPTPLTGYLNEQILCWNEHGAPSPDQIRHTKFSKNINLVTCSECKEIWRIKNAIY